MDFRILGPIEIIAAGAPLPLTASKPRTLLAAGLLEANRVVSVRHLIDTLWPESAPSSAERLVHTYVWELRRLLQVGGQQAVLVTAPPGYKIRIPEDSLDLHRFQALTRRGRALAADRRYGEASATFRQALALWRGPALGGASPRALHAEAARLRDLRLDVVEEWARTELAGAPQEGLTATLGSLVAKYPLRERLRGLLMSALYRAGRQAEALEAYRRGVAVLRDELGVDPGPDLSRLHRAILRYEHAVVFEYLGISGGPDDAILVPTAAAARPALRPVDVPVQLPAAVDEVFGRAALVERACRSMQHRRDAPTVWAFAGMPGVGKTALAVQIAHRVRDRFPDGQLFARLHAADSTSPAPPALPLRRFLRALGVPVPEVPEDDEQCETLLRSLLAHRRVLLLLDDAASEEQVRPLLPAAGSSAALVTSLRPLVGLDGVTSVRVEPLAMTDAVRLLAYRAGAHRIEAEPVASAELARMCGYLPLALRAAGERLRWRPQWPINSLLEMLRDDRRALDLLSIGALSIRESLRRGYAQLGIADQSALRRIAALPVSTLTSRTITRALGMDPHEAELCLERLAEFQMLEQAGVNNAGRPRYTRHRLVTAFARQLVPPAPAAAPRDRPVCAPDTDTAPDSERRP